MAEQNLPLQMIAVCDPNGRLEPLRFRFEDPEHCLHTAQVTALLDTRAVEYAGAEAFHYVCRARLEGREKLFELRYAIRTHRWVLLRELY